jgi:hypothetical protein
LYNYLLQLYAHEDGAAAEERLLGFLQAHAGAGAGGLLDVAYALRVCARHGRTRACVHLYSCMGMYEVRFFVFVLFWFISNQEGKHQWLIYLYEHKQTPSLD